MTGPFDYTPSQSEAAVSLEDRRLPVIIGRRFAGYLGEEEEALADPSATGQVCLAKAPVRNRDVRCWQGCSRGSPQWLVAAKMGPWRR